MGAAIIAVWQSKTISSVINDCVEPGITRGLTQPVFMKLARLPSGRLSAPLSPAQSLLHETSFKTTDAAARRDFFLRWFSTVWPDFDTKARKQTQSRQA